MRNTPRCRFWSVFAFFALIVGSFYISKLSFKKEVIQTILHNYEYCIGQQFLKATENFRDDGLEPVTLALHGTFDTIEDVEKKPENWDGPISFALFIDSHSEKALDYVADLHRCHEEFRRKVTVQIAFRISPFQFECPVILMPFSKRPCEQFLKNQKQYRKSVDGSFDLYPINLMRNLARQGAQSDLHLIVDADMVMSRGFAIKVKPIANKMIDGKNRKALVVRRFETNDLEVPKNVLSLKKAVQNMAVFEFHHKFFFVGHRIPNLGQWFNKSESTDEVTSWEVPFAGSQWEVQVILHRNDLYNADYFPSRIRDMQSLIYGLCRANYTFNLLSHVFNVHKGIKTDDTLYSKMVADYSKKYHRTKAYNRYVQEMDEQYPETKAKCGGFEM